MFLLVLALALFHSDNLYNIHFAIQLQHVKYELKQDLKILTQEAGLSHWYQ